MLRPIFVVSIILLGVAFSIQGPFYMLLFYLWNAYFRPEYWLWWDFVSVLNISLILGTFLLLRSVGYLHDFRWTGQTILLVLFLIQSAISLVASEHFAYSWVYWVEFIKVGIITLLITLHVNERRRYRLVLLVVGLSLGLETAKQGWAQLVLNPGATNNNPNPFLGDNNGVATGMMMLIPYFVALAQTSTRWWEKYIHRFFIIGLLYRGISTYSRGGLLAAAALGLMALWWSPKKIRALIAIVVLAVVVGSVMPQSFYDRMNTINSSDDERDSSASSRIFFWQIGVRMANAKPITGVGFNGFRNSLATYDTSNGVYGTGRAVHSAWFGVLSEMGYPGFILFVLIIGNGLYISWRIRWRARKDPALKDIKAYASAMQMSLVAYVVGNTFLNGQYNEMFWHMVGLGIALQAIAEKAMAPVAEAPARAVLTKPAPLGAPLWPRAWTGHAGVRRQQ